jgi:hypothetical protein
MSHCPFLLVGFGGPVNPINLWSQEAELSAALEIWDLSIEPVES